MKLCNIGNDNFVSIDRVVSVLSGDSAPVKRLVQSARQNAMLIDATQGKKTQTVLVCDSNHVILSYLPAQTVAERIKNVELQEKAHE